MAAEFGLLFQAVSDFESAMHSVVIDSGDAPVDSAYQLPYSVQNQLAVHHYIEANHPVVNAIYSILGGALSTVDATGTSFAKVITIRVVFPDGSEGLFYVKVLGLGSSHWAPVEESFLDADGDQIFFDSSDYKGQQGIIGPDSAAFLIDLLTAGGWSVGVSGVGDCSWSCDNSGDDCVLSCETL